MEHFERFLSTDHYTTDHYPTHHVLSAGFQKYHMWSKSDHLNPIKYFLIYLYNLIHLLHIFTYTKAAIREQNIQILQFSKSFLQIKTLHKRLI